MNINQQFTAFKTIVTKEILRFARIWVQTVVPPVITTESGYCISLPTPLA